MKKNDRNRALKNAGILNEVQEYKVHIDVPEKVMIIYNAFKKHNKNIYIVGGYIRDFILGKKGKDVDLLTQSPPDEVLKILNTEGIRRFPKGESFGVVSAVIDGEEFEIATMRKEEYDDDNGRRPTSVSFSDMEQDSNRRDIRFNSLIYDIGEQKIIDFHDGYNDIINKKVRAIGNPMDRIKEDRLRSLRFLRFSHRFGSTLDNETIQAIIHFKDLPGVSNERIRDEFNKALHSSQHPEYFLEEFLSLGLGPRTFGNVELDTSHAPDLRNPVLVLAKLLWKNVDQEIRKCLLNFKSPSDEIDAVVFLKNIVDRFKNFDKLVFDPQIDGKWLLILNRAKNLMLKRGVLTEGDIQLWSQIMGLNGHLIKTFIDFEPIYSGSDFPEMKQGKELGEKISVENAKHFLKNL